MWYRWLVLYHSWNLWISSYFKWYSLSIITLMSLSSLPLPHSSLISPHPQNGKIKGSFKVAGENLHKGRLQPEQGAQGELRGRDTPPCLSRWWQRDGRALSLQGWRPMDLPSLSTILHLSLSASKLEIYKSQLICVNISKNSSHLDFDQRLNGLFDIHCFKDSTEKIL